MHEAYRMSWGMWGKVHTCAPIDYHNHKSNSQKTTYDAVNLFINIVLLKFFKEKKERIWSPEMKTSFFFRTKVYDIAFQTI